MRPRVTGGPAGDMLLVTQLQAVVTQAATAARGGLEPGPGRRA
jgi:hypothetical protein